MIVHTTEPATLIGAGELSQNTLNGALMRTNKIIAADGGASLALRFGIVPDAVIGDMDSFDPKDKARIDPSTMHTVAEQDSTDFEKVLQRVETPIAVGVGFLGARVDHQLACFTTLVKYARQKIILLGEIDVVFVVPQHIKLAVAAGTRVSLYPLGTVSGTSEGLNWPINGLEFSPKGQIGTSNHATGPVTLTMNQPNMLAILPADQFDAVFRAISVAAKWPAHAG